jgi:hypothetical protein
MQSAVNWQRTVTECLIAFACGAIVLILPVALDPETAAHPIQAQVLPVVATAVERVKLYSLGLLVVLGVALGVFAKGSALLLSLCAVLAFPLWSVADIASGRDHNLLPLEWAVYAFYVFLPLVGISGGRAAKRYVASGT